MSQMSKGLRVYNSLTRSVEEFIPRDPLGRRVTWYSCGPTVYDASHMGHARSYITFDILRRVMTNYFGYEVFFVMNVTDIDDKIIKRARQEYLLQEYLEQKKNGDGNLPSIISDVNEALKPYEEATTVETDPDKKNMRLRILEKVKQVLQEEKCPRGVVLGCKDVLCDLLDKRAEGRVFENDIFADFARQWEDEYFRDMQALNVLPPDVLTRVSEYVPEIVEFIEKIVQNGYAYESNGSVYFDVVKYRQSPNHKYAKLVPEAVGNDTMLLEGEGELTTSRVGEKKSAADFALWKNSRPGEPSWDSPWGKGRPGWHIECSAMASAIVGQELDIHTGGVDLKFPHHDNEIAQSEAYFECDDWVKYFLHSGHLTIAGCKMSKSLKNFITIQDALRDYTASQLRMTFLLHSWKDTLDYSPSGMQTAVQLEGKIQEFFLNVKDCLRNNTNPYPKWTPEDLQLQKSIQDAKTAVHSALCDNVDTRTAMFAVRDLICAANCYLKQKMGVPGGINAPLLKEAAKYVTSILRVVGVIQGKDMDSFGFPVGGGDGVEGVVNVEEIVLPFVEVLSDFREQIRNTAKSIADSSVKGSILKACDEIRDDKLPGLGVRLEDHEGCPTILKYVGKEAMQRELEQKRKLEADRALEKQKKKDEAARAQAEKEAQKRIPPSELFKKETDKYSQFNEIGLPTHDKDGNAITKSQLKKLEKLYSQQKKVYEEYLKSQSPKAVTNGPLTNGTA